MALVRPTRARPGTAPRPPRSQPKLSFTAKAPLDAAAIAPHGAGDVLANPPIQDGLPGYEAEAEAPVANEGFDHREAPAGEVGRAEQPATDIVPRLGWSERQLACGGVDAGVILPRSAV